MQALYILAALEGENQARTFLKYGGLDLVPCLNMCINLAREDKLPHPYITRIKEIRKALQGEGGLQELRNMAVHGVHEAADDAESVTLTMTRWHEPKRTQTVSYLRLFNVGVEIHKLTHEANSIGDDIWDRRLNILKNQADQDRRKLAEAGTPAWFKVAKSLKNRINGFIVKS